MAIETENKRTFDSGATRDTDIGKLDYEGFMHPVVIEAFARYMHFNRKMRDGSIRDSDNWQNGFPTDVVVKSMFRHFMSVWLWNRGHNADEHVVTALCALIFNAQALLLQELTSGRGGTFRDIIGHALAVEAHKRQAENQAPTFVVPEPGVAKAAPAPEHGKSRAILQQERDALALALNGVSGMIQEPDSLGG